MAHDLSGYEDGWAEIPVYRRGVLYGMAMVDVEDYDSLIGRLWRLHNGYAVHRVGAGVEFMHRCVLELPKGEHHVDHINGERLDNRRGNLRLATYAQNAQNQRARGGTSEHRGVSWSKYRQCWVARVNVPGKVYSRYAADELQAAAIAAELRRQHMPFSKEAMADAA